MNVLALLSECTVSIRYDSACGKEEQSALQFFCNISRRVGEIEFCCMTVYDQAGFLIPFSSEGEGEAMTGSAIVHESAVYECSCTRHLLKYLYPW